MEDLDNPRVFLDVEAGGEPVGRVVVTLFQDVVPITVENFRSEGLLRIFNGTLPSAFRAHHPVCATGACAPENEVLERQENVCIIKAAYFIA